MKTRKLVETENVKGANRVLRNLLERTRTENVGLGLFYGRAGLGKTRWATMTAHANNYVYMRLEENNTPKDFLCRLLSCILYNSIPDYEVVGTRRAIYSQILDFLQHEPDMVIMIDEVNYAFKKEGVLATIRDLADASLCTFVLIGEENSKDELRQKNSHYFDRCNGFFEFKHLSQNDVEQVIRELAEVSIDEGIAKFIHSKSNGTMRWVNKYIDALEKIGRKLKVESLRFEEIKDILALV